MPRNNRKKIVLGSDQVAAIVHRYVVGMESTRKIGHAFGICYNVVARYLRTAGIELDRNAHIAASAKGRPSPRRGTKVSAESRRKMSIAAKNRPHPKGGHKPHPPGYKWSLEARARHSIAMKKWHPIQPNSAKYAEARNDMKRMLRRVLKATGKRKLIPSEKALGYSRQQLAAHIEAQFRPGMSWGVRSSFHIDHKIPVSHFLKSGIFDPAIICALDNLQPLYPQENRLKRDRMEL